jgi:hypothetical protein
MVFAWVKKAEDSAVAEHAPGLSTTNMLSPDSSEIRKRQR